MKENVLEIKERLRKYLDSERVTADKIERRCGCGAGSVHRFLREDGSFSLSNLQKLGEGCPNLNMNWLLNGRGSMICSDVSNVDDDIHQLSENHAKELLASKEELNRALAARIETQEAYLKLLTEQFLVNIKTMIDRADEASRRLEKLSTR